MGASSVQSLSLWDLPKGYSKVCSMPCFTSIVHRVGDTPPGTYSKTVSLGPSDHSCNVTLSSYIAAAHDCIMVFKLLEQAGQVSGVVGEVSIHLHDDLNAWCELLKCCH